MGKLDIYKERIANLIEEQRLRVVPGENIDSSLLDLSSNDYMGMASDRNPLPLCWEGISLSGRREYEEYVATNPLSRGDQWSSSASRLLSGRGSIFSLLERILQEDYGRPALLFNSGYHANMGCIGALNAKGVTFFVDRLMHASVYDALAACRADFVRFRHNDVAHLEKLLDAASPENLKIVVTEGVFSMDGDRGNLRGLTELKRRRSDLLLYVDEAHSFGCYGPRGLGISAEYGLLDEIDILVGTFGKAAASMGAFAIASDPIHTNLINFARSFIFSTALPPVVILRSLENYLRLRGAEERREALRNKGMQAAVMLGLGASEEGSHILPVVTGDAGKALDLAARLREAGICGLAIRRPTVPPGQERVRLSVSATLDMAELERRLRIAGISECG